MRRRKSNRLQQYDYSRKGSYFITICSKNRESIFGSTVGALLACAPGCESPGWIQRIELSEIGRIIQRQWHDIPHFFHSVALDEFVIMPNHIHGILWIDNGKNKKIPGNVYMSGHISDNPARAQASSAPTLGGIIRAFKSICVLEYLNYIDKYGLNASAKIWQRSFFDHIIRDDESLNRIREYIRNNPSTWDRDRENPLFL